jgi:hypothetical protein
VAALALLARSLGPAVGLFAELLALGDASLGVFQPF